MIIPSERRTRPSSFNTSIIEGALVAGGSSTTASFLRSGPPTVGITTISNNILVNNRSNDTGTGFHLSSFMNAGFGNFAGDYNLFHGTGVGYALGADPAVIANLSAWQTATPGTQDDNSIFANPAFNTGFELACNSPAIKLAPAIAGVSSDFEGDTRGLMVDIGADETTFLGAPVLQPTGLALSTPDCTTVEVSFDAPAEVPTGYLVVRSPGAAEATAPSNFVSYSVNDAIGATGVVAYIGATPSFTDSNVLPVGTEFFYTVYAYNNSSTCSRFLTPLIPLGGSVVPALPAPLAQPATLIVDNPMDDSLDVTFPAASPAADGYIVLRMADSAVVDVPANGMDYVEDDVIGAATVAYVGPETTFTDSGLLSETTYHYAVFSFNATVGCDTVYLTGSPTTASGLTTGGFMAERDWMLLERQPVPLVSTRFSTTSPAGDRGSPAGEVFWQRMKDEAGTPAWERWAPARRFRPECPCMECAAPRIAFAQVL